RGFDGMARCVRIAQPLAAFVGSALLGGALLLAAAGLERHDPSARAEAAHDPLSALKAKFARPSFLPSPAANPPTPAKVPLRQRLFFDKEISATGTMACATCHDPKLAFSDGEPTGRGVTGKRLARHTPTIWNVAWSQLLFWDGRGADLEAQVRFPVEHPD